MRLGALEAGGTKMVCAIGNELGEIFERVSIPTETPEITMPKLIAYLGQGDRSAGNRLFRSHRFKQKVRDLRIHYHDTEAEMGQL